MSRPRKKGSKTPKYNLGLKLEEEEELTLALEEKELSYRKVVRSLVRRWLKEGAPGDLKFIK